MSKIDVSQLMNQMQTMAVAARTGSAAVRHSADSGEFGEVLARAIDHVNTTQKTAVNMATAYELGDANINIAELMIALQKANISFQAMLQVRNKLVSAYQEIMNLQI